MNAGSYFTAERRPSSHLSSVKFRGKMNEANSANMMRNFSKKIFAKMRNASSKTRSDVASTINCANKIVEFSALTAQYLKFFFYVTIIISLPLL